MNAICISGIPKYYKLTANSLKYLGNNNLIFLNISISNDTKNNTNYNYNIDDIINTYNPIKYIITDKLHYLYETETCDYEKYTNSTYNQCMNTINCLKLVQQYEIDNNMKFNNIIKLRFDICLLKYIAIMTNKNTLYVEYHAKSKLKFKWQYNINSLIGQNYDLIYDNKLLADYTDYIPDLFYYGDRESMLKFIYLEQIYLEHYHKYNNVKLYKCCSSWFSYFEKLLLFFVMINNLNIQVIGHGYTSLLHQSNRHSISYYESKFNVNFNNVLAIIDYAGGLIDYSNYPLYKSLIN